MARASARDVLRKFELMERGASDFDGFSDELRGVGSAASTVRFLANDLPKILNTKRVKKAARALHAAADLLHKAAILVDDAETVIREAKAEIRRAV